MRTALEQIQEEKIVAIARGVPAEKIVLLAEALLAGGISCIEVTFDQSCAEKETETLRAIQRLKMCLGDTVCVGAGTVMNTDQVRRAAEAGAAYMISPNVNESVIRETKRLGLLSIPGAMTPSEIVQAYTWGADIVKVFPASVLGTGFFKAAHAPLKHISMMAVGGITAENCAEFLHAGAVGVGVGGNLVNMKLLGEGRFQQISSIAQAYVCALCEKELTERTLP